MFDSALFAWRFRCLKWLRVSLLGGAALSLYLAFSLVLRPETTIPRLGIGAPESPLYLWLPAVLLVALGIVYLLALSLIHISEPTRLKTRSRMPSSA